MMTREERNKARSRARYEIRRPLLAKIKAQAAHIAELEAALRGLYEHTKNNQQICGLNERARAVLDKEEQA